jgi:hypothetical protein
VPDPALSTSARATYRALGGGTGADPFRNAGGGTGADPFRYEGGGTGAEPFHPDGGGTGAEPLAIITAPSLCDATTVFRPIAPARTSMARRSDVSLRDIECLQGKETPAALYIYLHQCQAAQTMSLYRNSTRPPGESLRQAFARAGTSWDAVHEHRRF